MCSSALRRCNLFKHLRAAVFRSFAAKPRVLHAILAAKPRVRCAALLLEDAEDFFFAHDQKFIAVELDLRTGVLAE